MRLKPRELCFAAALPVLGCGGEASGGRPTNPTGGCGAPASCAGSGGEGAGGEAGGSGTSGAGGSGAAGSGAAGSGAAGSGGDGGAAGGSCQAPSPVRWANWPMPHPASSGLPNPSSYELTDETALDNVTGLMWQRGASAEVSYDDAVSLCEALEVDGHCDFRLPTRIELVSLVDFTRTSPAIDAAAFPETEGEFFSSSEFAGYRFRIGADGSTRSATENQAPLGRARCVRRHVARSVPEPHYSVGSATVTDEGTGLVWQRELGSETHTFAEAQTYCVSLDLEGGGFRVPSMKELQTLLDETRSATPLIDEQAFPGFPDTVNPTFWTSSPSIRSNDGAWFVRGSVTLESAVDANVDAKFYVRCVR